MAITYTMAEAAEMAGVKYRTLARWFESGLIRPKGYKGRQRCPVPIGQKELREILIVAQLRDILPMKAVREAAEYLRKLGHNPYSQGRFAVVGGPPGARQLVKICPEGEAVQCLGRDQGQLMLKLWDEPTEGEEAD